jgi:hypothetical protein
MRTVLFNQALLVLLFATTACTKTQDHPQATPQTVSNSASGVNVDVKSTAFRKAVDARLEEMKKDEAVVESAPWFGRTGLTDEVERELPRYIRREFGRMLSEPGAIKASDLNYIGQFVESGDVVHYWQIQNGSKEPSFAYVVASPPKHRVIGWGDRRPPT